MKGQIAVFMILVAICLGTDVPPNASPNNIATSSELEETCTTIKNNLESMLMSLKEISRSKTRISIPGIAAYIENDVKNSIQKTQKKMEIVTFTLASKNNGIVACNSEIDRLTTIRSSVTEKVNQCVESASRIEYTEILQVCNGLRARVKDYLESCKKYDSDLEVDTCLMRYPLSAVKERVNLLKKEYDAYMVHENSSAIPNAINCITKAYVELRTKIEEVQKTVFRCVEEKEPSAALYMLLHTLA